MERPRLMALCIETYTSTRLSLALARVSFMHYRKKNNKKNIDYLVHEDWGG